MPVLLMMTAICSARRPTRGYASSSRSLYVQHLRCSEYLSNKWIEYCTRVNPTRAVNGLARHLSLPISSQDRNWSAWVCLKLTRASRAIDLNTRSSPPKRLIPGNSFPRCGDLTSVKSPVKNSNLKTKRKSQTRASQHHWLLEASN